MQNARPTDGGERASSSARGFCWTTGGIRYNITIHSDNNNVPGGVCKSGNYGLRYERVVVGRKCVNRQPRPTHYDTVLQRCPVSHNLTYRYLKT